MTATQEKIAVLEKRLAMFEARAAMMPGPWQTRAEHVRARLAELRGDPAPVIEGEPEPEPATDDTAAE